jgi:hypothetical protein
LFYLDTGPTCYISKPFTNMRKKCVWHWTGIIKIFARNYYSSIISRYSGRYLLLESKDPVAWLFDGNLIFVYATVYMYTRETLKVLLPAVQVLFHSCHRVLVLKLRTIYYLFLWYCKVDYGFPSDYIIFALRNCLCDIFKDND